MNKENTIIIARSAIRNFIIQSRFDTSVLAGNLEAKSILTAAESDNRDVIIENERMIEEIGSTIIKAIVPNLRNGIRERLERKSIQATARAENLAKALEDL